MTKVEVAKEITIAAIQNDLVNPKTSNNDSYIHMNEQVAENVAAFYNKLIEKLNILE